MNELVAKDAAEVITLLKTGDITPHDCLDALEERIAETESDVHALPTLCFERARVHADALMLKPLAQRGELAGLPVPIKDLTAVAGVLTTLGSRVFAEHVPAASDFLVQNLEGHGGVVYAKSNTPEFGLGANSFNDLFPTTRTPYNTDNSSAGSSGGAAAALACGSAWLAHGSDMAGSLRTPASFCGVSSLRPSPGVFNSDSQNMPLMVLGQQGPMARNIADLALLLAKQGVAVIEDCPDFTGADFAFDTLRAFGLASGLGSVLPDIQDKIKPEALWNIEQGLALTRQDVARAMQAQGLTMARSAAFMADVDCLICPAVQRASLHHAERYAGANDGLPVPEYFEWLRICCHTTTSGLPVLTLPAGFTELGETVAIQVVGKPCGELDLMQLGAALESALGTAHKPFDPRPAYSI